jgi:hypothetical protein
MVWSDLQRYIRKRIFTCVEDVMEEVKNFQKSLTPEKCQAYIDHLKEGWRSLSVKMVVGQREFDL